MRLAVWLLTSAMATGQIVVPVQNNTPKATNTVVYDAEQQVIPAGKRSTVELHFKVLDGYHVNSHTPKSEFLIPTVLKAQPAGGVALGTPVYSAGHEFSFAFSPSDKLDVYSGDFVIKLPVTASAGSHLMDASLHYQACDHAACYPPKTLPIQIPFTAK